MSQFMFLWSLFVLTHHLRDNRNNVVADICSTNIMHVSKH